MHLSSTKTKTKKIKSLSSTNRKYTSKSKVNINKSSNINHITSKRSISTINNVSLTNSSNQPFSSLTTYQSQPFTTTKPTNSSQTTSSTTSPQLSLDKQLYQIYQQLNEVSNKVYKRIRLNKPPSPKSVEAINQLNQQLYQLHLKVKQQTMEFDEQTTKLQQTSIKLQDTQSALSCTSTALTIRQQMINAMVEATDRNDIDYNVVPIVVSFPYRELDPIEVPYPRSSNIYDFLSFIFTNDITYPQLQQHKNILHTPKVKMYAEFYDFDIKKTSSEIQIMGSGVIPNVNVSCFGICQDGKRHINLRWYGDKTNNNDESNDYTAVSHVSQPQSTIIPQSTLLTNFMSCSNYQYRLNNITIQFWDETFGSLHIPLLKTNHSFRRFCIEHLGFNDHYYIKNGDQIGMVRAETSPFSTQFASQNLYISTPSLLNGEWFSIKQLEIDVNDLFIGHIITEHNATIKLKWLPDQINDNDINNHKQQQLQHEEQDQCQNKQEQNQNNQQPEQHENSQNDTKNALQQPSTLNENEPHEISIEHSDQQNPQQKSTKLPTSISIEHSDQNKLQQQTELSKIYFENASTLFKSGDKDEVIIRLESDPSLDDVKGAPFEITKPTEIKALHNDSLLDVLGQNKIAVPSQYFTISVSSPAVLNGQWVTINNDEISLQHTLLCGFLSPTLTKTPTIPTIRSHRGVLQTCSHSNLDKSRSWIEKKELSKTAKPHHLRIKWNINPKYNCTTEMKQKLLGLSSILTFYRQCVMNDGRTLLHNKDSLFQPHQHDFSYSDNHIPLGQISLRNATTTSHKSIMYPKHHSIFEELNKIKDFNTKYSPEDAIIFQLGSDSHRYELIGPNAIPNILQNIPLIYTCHFDEIYNYQGIDGEMFSMTVQKPNKEAKPSDEE